MTKEEEQKEMASMRELMDAVRFNHDIQGDNFRISVNNPSEELRKYRLGFTQLTLPHRFGMYKAQTKNFKNITETKIDDPETELDSAAVPEPDHKVRPIFQIDD